jgi:hypothetical protein
LAEGVELSGYRVAVLAAGARDAAL